MNKQVKLLVAAMLTLSLSSVTNAQQSQTQPTVQATGAPQAFKYQAVARNANGDAIANQPVSFRISIIQGSAEGTTVYSETQTSTTNQFGLANLSIGNGAVVSGAFSSINWENGNYFVKIEFDPKGGDNFTTMGTSQMVSVPYSLYAEHAKTADNVTAFPTKAALQGTNLQAPFDAPATGTLVYNTDSAGVAPYNVVPGYYYNAGTATDPKWISLSTDDVKSIHRALATGSNTTYGGTVQGAVTANATSAPTGSSNTGFGTNAFGTGTNPSGNNNTAVGYDALTVITSGATNTAVGAFSSQSMTTGGSNTAVGTQALDKTTTANFNTAVGDAALFSNTTGAYNSAIGASASYYGTVSNYNTAIGESSLQQNTTASYNTALGYNSLYTQSYNNGGSEWYSQNTAIGAWALYSNQPTSSTNGYQNTGVGYEALYYNSTGTRNTSLGMQAALDNTTGTHNTALGGWASYQNNTGSSNTATGYSALYGAIGNSVGSWNSAYGDSALFSNSLGTSNTGTGAYALAGNSSASYNVAEGYEALYNQSYSNGDAVWNSYNTAIGALSMYSNQPTSTTNGYENTGVGYASLYNNSTGYYNTGLGFEAAYTSTTAQGITAIGAGALYNNTSDQNTAVGTAALYTNTTGARNCSVGYKACGLSSLGSDLAAFGYEALYHNTSGGNSAFGSEALYSNTSGDDNTAVGQNALYSNTGSSDNTAVGVSALYASTGGNNTAVGGGALVANTTGSYNTSIGGSALQTNTTGTYNTAIGNAADVTSGALTNATAVGNGATATASNTMVFGNSSITDNYFTGNVHASCGVLACSDARYKKDVQVISPVLTSLMKVNAVNYYFKTTEELAQDGIKSSAFHGATNNEQQIGFIAQQIEPYFPTVVHTDAEGYKTIDYSRLTPILVRAVQEQQLVIDSLKNTINLQTGKIQSLQTTQVSEAQLTKQQSDKMADLEKQVAELKNLFNSMTQAQASIK